MDGNDPNADELLLDFEPPDRRALPLLPFNRLLPLIVDLKHNELVLKTFLIK
jgi:hypothetical protein